MAQLLLWHEAPLRVTAGGAWLHGDEPLHPRVQRLFARHLFWAADSGYSVRIRADRQPLAVADTALHVVACHVLTGADGGFVVGELTISDGAHEPCDLGRLWQGEGEVFYTQLRRRGAWLPCRFVPQAYYALAIHLEPAPEGGLCLGDRPLSIGRGRPAEQLG